MNPGITAGISSIAQTGNAVGGTLWSANNAARQASNNRTFQRNMYRERYQNTVRDLHLAGLNPVLAAGAGLGGGSSPAGSMATTPDMARALASVDYATSSKKTREGDLARRRGGLADAQTDLTRAQHDVAVNAAEREAANARKLDAETTNIRMQESRNRALEELWEGDVSKRFMQLKEMLPLIGIMPGFPGKGPGGKGPKGAGGGKGTVPPGSMRVPSSARDAAREAQRLREMQQRWDRLR